ncbi:MAG: hypothetical protein CL681_04555 [Blastopirellula sp.]|nr:hypothetical protein [Blastopirellula sp.]
MPRKRSTANALKRILAASTQPIYALDSNRQVVFCNAALLDWLELTEEQIINQRCDYHAQVGTSAIQNTLASLCPPPEALAGQEMTLTVCVRQPNGSAAETTITFMPLSGEEDPTGILCLVGQLPQEMPPAMQNMLHRQLSEFRTRHAQYYRLEQVIGESPAMQRARNQVAAAMASGCGAFIVGEEGSGREHLARTIHYGDDAQAAPPLLPIACPLFDAELLQATVTSFASRIREENAQVSFSLLLFDCDQLPEEAQHELLGLLTLPRINIRTIATATHPLETLLERPGACTHLLHALGTIEVLLPPLRERPEDIPHLAQHFLEANNMGTGKQLSGFAVDALARLSAYSWPSNLDDLEDAVREACRGADGPLIARSDLPERLEYSAQANALPRLEEEAIVLDTLLADVEREVLQRALRAAKGNKAQAARSLGISRARLHRRVEHFGLE